MTSPLARTTAVACAATLGTAVFVADVVTLPAPAAVPVPANVQTVGLAGVDPTALRDAPPGARPGDHHGHRHEAAGVAEVRGAPARALVSATPGGSPTAGSGQDEHGQDEHGHDGPPDGPASSPGTTPTAGGAEPESQPAAPSPAVPFPEPSAQPPAQPSPGAPSTTEPAPAGAGPEVLTGQLETEEFSVVGVTWEDDSAPDGLAVQVRVREADGWSDWELLEVSDEGPDAGTEEYEASHSVGATVPLVTDEADALQVRVDTPGGEAPEDLEAVLVDPGESPADETLGTSTPLSSAEARLATPTIVRRAAWGADESKRRCSSASYSDTIKAATVHHTAGTSSYSASQSAAIVRGVYAYHTDGLGWCDIGYNFLVDKYGTVFEGRYGGITAAVRGAHAGGFNRDTVGIAALGDFTRSGAPTAMVAAIGRIAGWKLALYDRPVYGTTALTSAGGGTSRYSSGTTVQLNRVMGHRDVGSTSCPGGSLYARLGDVRRYAAQVAATAVDEADLFVGLANGGSGRVELHMDSRSSRYSRRALSLATGLPSQDRDDWRFFVGPYLGDDRPDLIGVHAKDTDSGRLEVEIWSAASNYKDKVLDVVTPMHEVSPHGSRWQIDIAPDSEGRSDVYLMRVDGSGGTVDIHSLTAASEYRSFGMHFSTALGSMPASDIQLLVDDRRNLWVVKYAGRSGSNRMEAHYLTYASRYRRFGNHVPLPHRLGPSSHWRFDLADYDGDRRQDLYLIKVGGTGSGRTEVHVLSRTTGLQRWTLHAATSLPQAPPPRWTLSLAD